MTEPLSLTTNLLRKICRKFPVHFRVSISLQVDQERTDTLELMQTFFRPNFFRGAPLLLCLSILAACAPSTQETTRQLEPYEPVSGYGENVVRWLAAAHTGNYLVPGELAGSCVEFPLIAEGAPAVTPPEVASCAITYKRGVYTVTVQAATDRGGNNGNTDGLYTFIYAL